MPISPVLTMLKLATSFGVTGWDQSPEPVRQKQIRELAEQEQITLCNNYSHPVIHPSIFTPFHMIVPLTVRTTQFHFVFTSAGTPQTPVLSVDSRLAYCTAHVDH